MAHPPRCGKLALMGKRPPVQVDLYQEAGRQAGQTNFRGGRNGVT